MQRFLWEIAINKVKYTHCRVCFHMTRCMTCKKSPHYSVTCTATFSSSNRKKKIYIMLSISHIVVEEIWSTLLCNIASVHCDLHAFRHSPQSSATTFQSGSSLDFDWAIARVILLQICWCTCDYWPCCMTQFVL